MSTTETSLQEILEVDRPEQLKALGHPLRLKVLQALGETDKALTNRELAERLSVDPGHLHFHVRMLQRAGLIERVGSGGREKPYRPVAKRIKIGKEFRAAGLASDLQAAQLHDLQRGFERYAPDGQFRTSQVHAKLDGDTVRMLLDELIDRMAELEDDAMPLTTITIAFHPAIEQADS